MESNTKLKGLMRYSPVVCFLALEVFALISFSLGNSPFLFGLLSFLLAIVLIIFSLREIKVYGVLQSLVLFIPFVVYIILTLTSTYTRAHIYTNDFSILDIVFVGLGLTAIAISGYILSLHKAFKISTLLTVIYSGLALLVFINLLINLINFGPFYSLIYKDYYMYYGGKRSDVMVSDLAYALEGFKFVEVKMAHYTIYPVLLLTSSLVLINLKYKENKIKFLAYLGFVILSILALAFVPSLVGLISFIGVALIIGLIMLFKKTKISHLPFKIILYILLGFAALVFLVMLFNNQGFAGNFSNFIANNGFLNKVFNTNQYAKLYNPNLTDVLCSERFFGFYYHQVAYFYSDLAHLTDSILFDNFMTSGVIGVTIIVFLFTKGFLSFSKYKANDNKSFIEKNGMFLFVITYLLYSFMCADGEYGIFHNIIRPTYMTSMFMIVIFMIFYVYSTNINNKQEEANNEI